MTNRTAAVEFVRRLASVIEGDDDAPEIAIAANIEADLQDDGRVRYEIGASEAIIILRGPGSGRLEALNNLLAKLNTQ